MSPIKRSFSGIAMSLAELIVGILLLVNPVGFTSGIIAALGVGLMIAGVCSVVRYFRADPEEASVKQLLTKGLVELLGGAFCAFNSHWFIVTFPVLALVYGVVILITGLTKIQWLADVIRLKRRRWYLAAISAIVSICCGVVIIIRPFSTTAVLWMFTGISLILEAVFDMISAIFGNLKKNPVATGGEEGDANETASEGISPEGSS